MDYTLKIVKDCSPKPAVGCRTAADYKSRKMLLKVYLESMAFMTLKLKKFHSVKCQFRHEHKKFMHIVFTFDVFF